MAKRAGTDQIMPDLEAHMQESFNRLTREIMRKLATKKRSPVYTGFFASSWKADRRKIQPIDDLEQPWLGIKRKKDADRKNKDYKIDPRFYPPDKEFNYKRRVFIGNQVKYAVWALEDGRVQHFVQSPEMQEIVKRNFKERRRALISVAGKGGVGQFGSFKGKTYIDYFEVAQ
nr:HK97-gp10_like tail component [uncultured Mediterranean phage uvMED]